MGLSSGVWGAFPVEKPLESGESPTLLQRLPGERPIAPCTVELLQAFEVVLGQAVLGGVVHRALVKGPHDGVGR